MQITDVIIKIKLNKLTKSCNNKTVNNHCKKIISFYNIRKI